MYIWRKQSEIFLTLSFYLENIMCVIHDTIQMESEMYLFLTTDCCTIFFFSPPSKIRFHGAHLRRGLCSSISCLFIF